MRYTRIFLLLVCAFGNCSLYASDRDTLFAKDALIIEALGHGQSLVSVNHEHRFKSVNHIFRLTFRYGIGLSPGYFQQSGNRIAAVWSAPVAVFAYLGREHNFFVFGAGYTASFGRKWIDSTVYPTEVFNGFASSFIISAGYRHNFKGDTYLGVYPLVAFGSYPAPLGLGMYIGGGLGGGKKRKRHAH